MLITPLLDCYRSPEKDGDGALAQSPEPRTTSTLRDDFKQPQPEPWQKGNTKRSVSVCLCVCVCVCVCVCLCVLLYCCVSKLTQITSFCFQIRQQQSALGKRVHPRPRNR